MVEAAFDASGLLAKADRVVAQAHEQQRSELHQHIAAHAADGAQQTVAQSALPFPPGFVGALAQFVYQSAPRPVAEVAVVAALGAMAGIAGREWSISGTGLNLYIVLVARSGIGKEAMHSGITKLIRAAAAQYAEIRDVVETSDFASGPALIKGCVMRPCFVNVAGEIGHKFVEMAEEKGGGPMRGYRKVLTDLYAKSGPGGMAGGISYSNQENNVSSVDGVAFSLIGETTPGKFYQSLTPAMMEDGFLSRFCVIEYTGDLAPRNRAHLSEPHPSLVDWFNGIYRQSILLRTRNQFMPVAVTPEAQAMFDAFETECDNHTIAAGDDEGQRQLWVRANLKVLRVSALLAVGDNPFSPTVTAEQVQWAILLIRHGIATFERRIRTGEVGEGSDGGREQKVMELCREFLTLPADKLPDWLRNGADMQRAGIVPYKYLQRRTQRLSAFEKHPFKHTKALELTLKTAMVAGNLMEVKKDKLVEMFGFHGQAFRVLSLS